MEKHWLLIAALVISAMVTDARMHQRKHHKHHRGVTLVTPTPEVPGEHGGQEVSQEAPQSFWAVPKHSRHHERGRRKHKKHKAIKVRKTPVWSIIYITSTLYTTLFSKMLTNRLHSSPVRRSYGVSYGTFYSDLYFALIIVTPYVIRYDRPCYKGVLLKYYNNELFIPRGHVFQWLQEPLHTSLVSARYVFFFTESQNVSEVLTLSAVHNIVLFRIVL